MAKNILYNYGLTLFNEFDLSKQRLIGNFNNEDWFNNLVLSTNPTEWIETNFHKIQQSLLKFNFNQPIHFFQTAIKEHHAPNDKYSMEWHIDNCSLVKRKKDFVEREGETNFTLINDNNNKYDYYLFGKNRPKYTLIIYLSDKCQGGELCFLDKNIIPNKGLFVLFSSLEIHSVKNLINGHRKAVVIKLF